jgi:hypothetical protein
MLGSRDLLARVMTAPAVAGLPSVRGNADAGAEVSKRLTVTELAPDVLSVALTGSDPDDMAVILTELAKRYIDDATAADRRTLDDQIRKQEQYADSLRTEIEAMEKQLELLGLANSTTGGEDRARQLALLQQRHIDADTDDSRLGREIGQLEAEVTVLKRQVERKEKDPAPPGAPNREARLAQLATQIEIKKEEREKVKTDRDAVKKLLDQSVSGGLHMASMRKDLQPQREALARLNTALAQLRMQRMVDRIPSVRGEVVVVPARTGADRALALGVPAASAFVGGFILATAFSFVGLLFRVLRRYA